MKKITDESLYLINPQLTDIPDVGLGKFVLGYTSANTPFNWKWVWWLLFPIVGWFCLIIYIIAYLYKHYFKVQTVIFFEKGIYSITTSRNANIRIGGANYRYDDIIGFSDSRTRQYTNGIYSGTGFQIDWLTKEKQFGRFISGSYRNEYEEPDEYNFDGYLAQAVIKSWNSRALEHHLHELEEKHYTSFFYVEHNVFKPNKLIEVQVSPEQLAVGENSLDAESIDKYMFNEGYLWLYPKKEMRKKKSTIRIDVNHMFDKSVFLAMIRTYFGIE